MNIFAKANLFPLSQDYIHYNKIITPMPRLFPHAKTIFPTQRIFLLQQDYFCYTQEYFAIVLCQQTKFHFAKTIFSTQRPFLLCRNYFCYANKNIRQSIFLFQFWCSENSLCFAAPRLQQNSFGITKIFMAQNKQSWHT